MRIAYADPPYIGCSHLYHEKKEVDHGALVASLLADYPDGWALSCHSPSLRVLLPLMPDDVRVMAWVKPFAVFKPNVGVAYAWEPVLIRGGRRRLRKEDTARDWVSVGITLQRGLVGAKPERFCWWLFDVLGMRDGDEFVDLYPGTGAVTVAWDTYRRQQRLFAEGASEDSMGGEAGR